MTDITKKDHAVLRDLARKVAEIAQMPKQEERRELWRKHNSLAKTRPPVRVRANASWQEVFPDDQLECENPQLRALERGMRQTIFQDSLNDDCITEPWITVKAIPGMRLGNVRWGRSFLFRRYSHGRHDYHHDQNGHAPDCRDLHECQWRKLHVSCSWIVYTPTAQSHECAPPAVRNTHMRQ